MLDWLIKHPIVIFMIIMGVSSLFKYLKASGEAPPETKPGPMDGADDGERTRRLQEEIRRKIAERRGQPAMPPPMSRQGPEPAFPAPMWTETREERSPYQVPEPPPLVMVDAVDPVLARQRELAEQLAALQVQHEAIKRAAREAAQPAESGSPAGARATADVYDLRELRNARSLRKAIVLREVIGPPVALR